eukprot:gene847-142_t
MPTKNSTESKESTLGKCNSDTKRKHVNNLCKEVNETDNEQVKIQHSQVKKELSEQYKLEQKIYITEKVKEIQEAANNQQASKAWQIVNENSGRKCLKKSILKANTTQERLNSWKSHFASLLGQPPNIIDVPIILVFQENTNIITEDFTMEELETTLKAIKTRNLPVLTTFQEKSGSPMH